MFDKIDSNDIAKIVAEEMGDLPEIIVKKILDHQFREVSKHIVNNNMDTIKLDFIGKINNGRKKYFQTIQERKFNKQIEEIFKDYKFNETI